ncbi:DNA-binding response regulator [Sphingomonas spermidinifaciens]|uniref:DNA-binding response regulator n=1 Tax=Sphingomonas spermidinifaciens TaxID=1141889 RepID=A0A2A4B1F3_9SPHN|nr:sigma-54 dependent transcriptional regulator [Sphingomonas spermidinifaciens]PCD01782.1 DNA-binding response regulator [Sphingomonas spermidinifaciens]
MTGAPLVALIDDDDDLRRATAQLLTLAGHEVRTFAAAEPALGAIDGGFPGIVVTDIRMPGMSGLELFRALHARDAELPVILVTGHGDVDMAVSAIKAGAWDFLAKPFGPDALLAAVSRAAATRALTIENRRLRAGSAPSVGDELIGRSSAIARLRATLPTLADAGLDIVIEGATGTGKRLVARLIHRAGKRGRHRFATIDCATVADADALFEARGPIAGADRGTLFLDHLDRASPALQHRLAQLAERRAVALDSREPLGIDVRIIAAIDEGARERVEPALYHRLAAVALRLPPLAERPEDVPLLAAHFVATIAEARKLVRPPDAATAALAARSDWPGNVRELEMAAERLVLGLGDGEALSAADLPLPERVRAFERAAIVDAVRRTGGEVAAATRLLGIPRETFYYRVKRLGIDLKDLRDERR